MVQITGFRVDVFTKSGPKGDFKGTVIKVVDKTLYLTNVELSNGSKLNSTKIAGSDIKDLKVIGIPKELQNKVKNSEKLKKQDHGSSSISSTPRTKNRKSNNVYSNDINDITWGDETVSNIKNSQDFDFEKSTAQFDKSFALEEFINNDDIDPSKRLVANNKLKYENSENVLSDKRDNWDNNENEKPQTRTNNHIKSASANLSEIVSSRSPSLDIRGYHLISSNKEKLPLATPIQLLEVERLSLENFQISPTLLAENASKSIANIILKKLGGSTRLSNHNLPPLIILLVGNNKAGSRVLASGRQLTNQGVRVVTFTLFDKIIDDIDETVKFQLELFQLGGGKRITSLEELNQLIDDLDSPIELIVDSLQGYDNDLWGDELIKANKLIQWANNQTFIDKISIDIPSGIDAGSGLIINDYFIDAKIVISLGLPLNGLVLAYSNGIVSGNDWVHYLVDIGIPKKLFQRGNLRKFERNWFSGNWQVQLEAVEK